MGKWFPKIYDPFMIPLEKIKFRSIRKKLILQASGKVLEIGSGTGLNFPYYTKAEKVVAIEPDPMMLDQSLKRAKQAKVPIEVKRADAQILPFSDNSFDTVVGTLVLCTIPDPDKALNEMRRVCKPNGQVLFFEHVSIKHPVWRRLQNWMTPLWKRICGGCHLDRDTLNNIKKAGLTIERVENYNRGLFLVIKAIN